MKGHSQPVVLPGQIGTPGTFGRAAPGAGMQRVGAFGQASGGRSWTTYALGVAVLGAGGYLAYRWWQGREGGGRQSFARPAKKSRRARSDDEDGGDCVPGPVPSSTEARAWLADNENASPFATEAFGSKAAALKLVDKLYDAGASYVQVAGVLKEHWRLCDEGGPYADTLMVKAPEVAREDIEAVLADAGADEIGVTKSGRIRGWWD